MATAGSASTPEDTPVQITLRGSDADTCELTFEITNQPDHGVLGSLTPAPCGSGTDTATVQYTPAQNFDGSDELRFSVADDGPISSEAAVSITVDAVNDAPVNTVPSTPQRTSRNTSLAISGLAVDDFEATQLQITLTASNGLIALAPVMGLSGCSAGATSTKTCTGTIAQLNTALAGATFSPAQGFTGAASLDIQTSDLGASGSGGVKTDSETLAITVTHPPTPTLTIDPLDYTVDGTTVAIDPGVTIFDPDPVAQNVTGATVAITTGYQFGLDVLALLSPPAGITAGWNASTGVLTLTGTASATAYQNALKAVTFRHNSDASSTVSRVITFSATDGMGTGTGTRPIAVLNDAPTAGDDPFGSTSEDTVFVASGPMANLLSNDTDPDVGDTKTINKLNGSANLVGLSAKGAPVQLHSDGSFSYDPRGHFEELNTEEQDTDTFQYTMRDAAGAESTATVTITIHGVTDPP